MNKRLAVVSIYILLILIASVLPTTDPTHTTWFDKVVHFGMYGLLSLGLLWWKPDLSYRAALLSALYGMIIEIIQHLLPYRTFDLWDAVANTVGAFSCWLGYRLLAPFK